MIFVVLGGRVSHFWEPFEGEREQFILVQVYVVGCQTGQVAVIKGRVEAQDVGVAVAEFGQDVVVAILFASP